MNKYTENILKKAEVEEYLSENISVAYARIFLDKINLRFITIMEILRDLRSDNIDYFDFDNMDEDSRGFFEISRYAENVGFSMFSSGNHEPNSKNGIIDWDKFKFNKSFPTSWLYTDFEMELSLAISENLKDLEQDEKEELARVEEAKNAIRVVEAEINDAKAKILAIVPKELHEYIKFLSYQDLDKIRKEKERLAVRESAARVKQLKANANVNVSNLYREYRNSGGQKIFHEWILSQ